MSSLNLIYSGIKMFLVVVVVVGCELVKAAKMVATRVLLPFLVDFCGCNAKFWAGSLATIATTNYWKVSTSGRFRYHNEGTSAQMI